LSSELPPHPNVVQLFGVSLDGPQPVIVMEYCTGGTHIEREKEREITTKTKTTTRLVITNSKHNHPITHSII
jgi:serine/threonine protein kinase